MLLALLASVVPEIQMESNMHCSSWVANLQGSKLIVSGPITATGIPVTVTTIFVIAILTPFFERYLFSCIACSDFDIH